jgi:hypothetical protein
MPGRESYQISASSRDWAESKADTTQFLDALPATVIYSWNGGLYGK